MNQKSFHRKPQKRKMVIGVEGWAEHERLLNHTMIFAE